MSLDWYMNFRKGNLYTYNIIRMDEILINNGRNYGFNSLISPI